MYKHRKSDNFEDVGRFHTKFGLPVSFEEPQDIDPEVLLFRARFLQEELHEFMDAAGMVWAGDGSDTIVYAEPGEEVDLDHVQLFDALLDLVYVAMGTAHMLGYPWEAGWNRVQNANMQKVRARKDGSDSKRGSSFDVVKPEGWRPPDIEGLLQAYGWDINQ